MPAIVTEEQRLLAGQVREVLATYAEARDLVSIGAYVKGSNPQIDYAMDRLPYILRFLRQRPDEHTEQVETHARLAVSSPMAACREVAR